MKNKYITIVSKILEDEKEPSKSGFKGPGKRIVDEILKPRKIKDKNQSNNFGMSM